MMDIIELKAVNSKMLKSMSSCLVATTTATVTTTNTTTTNTPDTPKMIATHHNRQQQQQPNRKEHNNYCEFDIMEKYQNYKKNQQQQHHHHGHSNKHHRSIKQIELDKKIKSIKTRNDEIEMLYKQQQQQNAEIGGATTAPQIILDVSDEIAMPPNSSRKHRSHSKSEKATVREQRKHRHSHSNDGNKAITISTIAPTTPLVVGTTENVVAKVKNCEVRERSEHNSSSKYNNNSKSNKSSNNDCNSVKLVLFGHHHNKKHRREKNMADKLTETMIEVKKSATLQVDIILPKQQREVGTDTPPISEISNDILQPSIGELPRDEIIEANLRRLRQRGEINTKKVMKPPPIFISEDEFVKRHRKELGFSKLNLQPLRMSYIDDVHTQTEQPPAAATQNLSKTSLALRDIYQVTQLECLKSQPGEFNTDNLSDVITKRELERVRSVFGNKERARFMHNRKFHTSKIIDRRMDKLQITTEVIEAIQQQQQQEQEDVDHKENLSKSSKKLSVQVFPGVSLNDDCIKPCCDEKSSEFMRMVSYDNQQSSPRPLKSKNSRHPVHYVISKWNSRMRYMKKDNTRRKLSALQLSIIKTLLPPPKITQDSLELPAALQKSKLTDSSTQTTAYSPAAVEENLATELYSDKAITVLPKRDVGVVTRSYSSASFFRPCSIEATAEEEESDADYMRFQRYIINTLQCHNNSNLSTRGGNLLPGSSKSHSSLTVPCGRDKPCYCPYCRAECFRDDFMYKTRRNPLVACCPIARPKCDPKCERNPSSFTERCCGIKKKAKTKRSRIPVNNKRETPEARRCNEKICEERHNRTHKNKTPSSSQIDILRKHEREIQQLERTLQEIMKKLYDESKAHAKHLAECTADCAPRHSTATTMSNRDRSKLYSSGVRNQHKRTMNTSRHNNCKSSMHPSSSNVSFSKKRLVSPKSSSHRRHHHDRHHYHHHNYHHKQHVYHAAIANNNDIQNVYQNPHGLISSSTSLNSSINATTTTDPKKHRTTNMTTRITKSKSRLLRGHQRASSLMKVVALLQKTTSTKSMKHALAIENNVMRDSFIPPATPTPTPHDTVTYPTDGGVISKEPFYISNTTNTNNTNKNNQTDASNNHSRIKSSEDSLDVLSSSYDASRMCPLTNVFNFKPPTFAYYVYNAAIKTNFKPPKSASPRRPAPPTIVQLAEEIVAVESELNVVDGDVGAAARPPPLETTDDDDDVEDDEVRMTDFQTLAENVASNSVDDSGIKVSYTTESPTTTHDMMLLLPKKENNVYLNLPSTSTQNDKEDITLSNPLFTTDDNSSNDLQMDVKEEWKNNRTCKCTDKLSPRRNDFNNNRDDEIDFLNSIFDIGVTESKIFPELNLNLDFLRQDDRLSPSPPASSRMVTFSDLQPSPRRSTTTSPRIATKPENLNLSPPASPSLIESEIELTSFTDTSAIPYGIKNKLDQIRSSIKFDHHQLKNELNSFGVQSKSECNLSMMKTTFAELASNDGTMMSSNNNSIIFNNIAKAKGVDTSSFVRSTQRNDACQVAKLTTFSQCRNEKHSTNSIFFNAAPLIKRPTSPILLDRPLSNHYLLKNNERMVSNFTTFAANDPNTHRNVIINYTTKIQSHSVKSNESGYDSAKTTKSSSIRNFFKRNSLFDLLKSYKNKKMEKKQSNSGDASQKKKMSVAFDPTRDEMQVISKSTLSKTLLRFNRTKVPKVDAKCSPLCITERLEKSTETCGSFNRPCKPCTTAKSTNTSRTSVVLSGDSKNTGDKRTGSLGVKKKCSCSRSSSYEKQACECAKYAEKVMQEAQLRKEGYLKQYEDFREIPLDVLMGKKVPYRSSFTSQPRTKPTTSVVSESIQTDLVTPPPLVVPPAPSTKSSRVLINVPGDDDIDSFEAELSKSILYDTSLLKRKQSDTGTQTNSIALPPSLSPPPPTLPSHLYESPSSRQVHVEVSPPPSLESQPGNINPSSPPPANLINTNTTSPPAIQHTESILQRTSQKFISRLSRSRKSADSMRPRDSKMIDADKRGGSNTSKTSTMMGGGRSSTSTMRKSSKQQRGGGGSGNKQRTSKAKKQLLDDEFEVHQTNLRDSLDSLLSAPDNSEEDDKKKDGAGGGNKRQMLFSDATNATKLNDKEVFDKLLDKYEKTDSIARRLSHDDSFFKEQLTDATQRSTEFKVSNEDGGRLVGSNEEKLRGPRFMEKIIKQTNPDCDVRPDDIGTCFARGFRPDNLMLSGEACFALNKQDKIKMTPNMLTNAESIIDFSERETPLDFLLALGFMVDEASNALKDDDIRSRLLAAITEARVWINRITTTQGTLLYLVAYKARPETMRYFLQLVEAIINKRINNAIKLHGFLKILDQVEDGRLQMINILGEDKFDDDENEEKMVKKQLKQLFVSVYNIAEKEAHDRGTTLSSPQISLLRTLVAKYRAGLHPHLELIARYIGQGLLDSDIQLEAAMIFLSRLDTAEVKLKEFENYCGITCAQDNKATTA